MIKINADDLYNFSVKIKKKSDDADEDIRKVIQKSCLSIKKNAMENHSIFCFIFSIIFCFLYACSDEFHQLF